MLIFRRHPSQAGVFLAAVLLEYFRTGVIERKRLRADRGRRHWAFYDISNADQQHICQTFLSASSKSNQSSALVDNRIFGPL